MGQEIQRADAGEIIAAVERLAKEPKLIVIKGLDGKDVEVLAIPNGPGQFRLEATKQLQAGAQTGVQPHTGTARVTRIESFFDHVNRFKSDASVVFADVERGDPQLLAVIDYHDVKTPPTQWGGRHRTLYPFPVSEEMQAWAGIDGKPMNMITFARFIEGRLPDIFPPGDPGLDDRVKDFAINLRVRLGAAQEMYDLAHGIESRRRAAKGRSATARYTPTPPAPSCGSPARSASPSRFSRTGRCTRSPCASATTSRRARA